MKRARLIIGLAMSLVNCIIGFIYLFQGKPESTERIMSLLWFIFAIIK